MSAEQLMTRLVGAMHRKLEPDQRLSRAQPLFTQPQRAMLAGLVEAPLQQQLRDAPDARHAILALAYVLLEGRLAS